MRSRVLVLLLDLGLLRLCLPLRSAVGELRLLDLRLIGGSLGAHGDVVGGDLDRRVHRRLRRGLLDHLDGRSDGLLELRREDLRGRLDDAEAGLGDHLVESLLVGLRLGLRQHLGQVLVVGLVRGLHDLVGVPQRQMLLDVGDHDRQQRLGHDLAGAEHRRRHVGQMGLQVGDVVLRGEGHDRPAESRLDVLGDGVLLRRRHLGNQKLVPPRNLAGLEDALLDLAPVIEVGAKLGALGDHLHLREALGLGEDVGVADRDHVKGAVEVGSGSQQAACVRLFLGVVEVHGIEPVQDHQHAAHGVVQPAVDRREDDGPLLDTRQRRAYGRVLRGRAHVAERGLHDALGGVDHEAEKLEQGLARRIVRQRHRQLADVVNVQTALDLKDLGRLDCQGLPAARAALELQHALGVLDVG